jgi:hypothetical protein
VIVLELLSKYNYFHDLRNAAAGSLVLGRVDVYVSATMDDHVCLCVPLPDVPYPVKDTLL